MLALDDKMAVCRSGLFDYTDLLNGSNDVQRLQESFTTTMIPVPYPIEHLDTVKKVNGDFPCTDDTCVQIVVQHDGVIVNVPAFYG